MRGSVALALVIVAVLMSGAAEAKTHHRGVAPSGTTLAAAVASPGRSADNIKLDPSRKPAEVLSFLGLRPGIRVADMFGANHYWAEIFATAIGPRGQVIVWQPEQLYGDKARADFASFATSRPNVRLISSPYASPNIAPRSIDFMLINLDYHDVYGESLKYKIARIDPDAWLSIVFAAIKPGGTVGVIDHVGPAGDTRAIVKQMHRIDPAVVRADFERAGFVLDGESELLRNPADDHSLLVFDPAIRGKTDRFIYRFKRPR